MLQTFHMCTKRTSLFLFLILFFSFGFYSCKSTKHLKSKAAIESPNDTEREKKATVLLNEAYSYKGTKYKSGGTDKNGMDCSGLAFTSFKKIGINLPRVSFDQSKIGSEIKIENAEKGDLVFFETSGKARGINHVGIVSKKQENGNLFFIHATLKSGVTENNLEEEYYRKSFVKIMRVF